MGLWQNTLSKHIAWKLLQWITAVLKAIDREMYECTTSIT
jgi:hypothetical protein